MSWLSSLGIGKKQRIWSKDKHMNVTWFFSDEPVELPNGHYGTVIKMVDKNKQVKVRDDETGQTLTFPINKVKLLDDYQSIDDSLTTGSDTYKTVYGTSPHKAYKVQTFTASCSHYMSEFKLNDTETVYLTARSQYNKSKDDAVVPTMACYLDTAWLSHSAFWFTGDASRDDDLYDKSTVPTMYVNWRDMGTINLRELSQAVIWCLRRVEEGHKLSIGCYGAHGRTGTLLASLLVYQGSTAKEAIARVRKDHCNKAIETVPQEKLVADFEEALAKDKDINDGDKSTSTPSS